MILENPKRIADYNKRGLWKNLSIDNCFHRNLKQYPDFTALIDPVNREQFTNGAMQQFSNFELDYKVNQLSSAFLQAGLGKDDVIGLFLPNTWELIVGYLAIARIGAMPTHIHHHCVNLKLGKWVLFLKLQQWLPLQILKTAIWLILSAMFAQTFPVLSICSPIQ